MDLEELKKSVTEKLDALCDLVRGLSILTQAEEDMLIAGIDAAQAALDKAAAEIEWQEDYDAQWGGYGDDL